MYELLKGMRIVEGASFVAAPLCGLTFVQLGADVIRFDPVRGGPDYRRWPVAPNGASYYWEGLNKGKRSVALDLTSEEGRELAIALATANGDDSGYFVTNYPAKSFLAHELLAERRPDLITIRIAGSSDGRNAVDYTINCATGYPYYQTVRDALSNDARLSAANPMFEMRRHPSGDSYLTPGFPAELKSDTRLPVRPAPRLGEHTDEVLAEVIGLSAAKIGALHDARIVAGPQEPADA